MNKYINVAIKEAYKAYEKNEMPVGAVVVFNNKIISKGHNCRQIMMDVTAHAEIIAIKKAAKKLHDWRLNECDLYVTLEPCEMCKKVIMESRIRNVYYLVKKYDYKKIYDRTTFIEINNNALQSEKNEYLEKLSTFFKIKR